VLDTDRRHSGRTTVRVINNTGTVDISHAVAEKPRDINVNLDPIRHDK